MLEKCRNAQERWGGVSDIIDHWLEDRRQLISRFIALPDQDAKDQLQPKLDEFCAYLVDYLSEGHFEVYEQLMREGDEFNDGSLEKAQQLFPQIQNTTEYALDFNDAYGKLEDTSLRTLCELARSLSTLGEQLEERFALEDSMIEILHTAHKDEVMAREQVTS